MRAQATKTWAGILRRRRQPKVKLLACIKTCEAHKHYLERFHESELGSVLREMPGTLVLEVYADPDSADSRIDGNRLILRAPEGYEDLPLKTQALFEFSVRHVRFDNLLSVDVTVVMNEVDMSTPAFEGRRPLDIGALAHFVRTADYRRDYDGFMLHERPERNGIENWARVKGLTIDYDRLFGDGPIPPFYSGKCFMVSRRFAEYVARHGAPLAAEHRRHLPGSDDLMIGRLYDRFRGDRPALS